MSRYTIRLPARHAELLTPSEDGQQEELLETGMDAADLCGLTPDQVGMSREAREVGTDARASLPTRRPQPSDRAPSVTCPAPRRARAGRTLNTWLQRPKSRAGVEVERLGFHGQSPSTRARRPDRGWLPRARNRSRHP